MPQVLAMSDAFLILNAGSSSVKFSVFADGDSLQLLLRGQIESLLAAPRFTIEDAHGKKVGENSWPAGSSLTHEQAIEYLFSWGLERQLDGHHLVAAGHRVVHGGLKFLQPVLADESVITELELLAPLAPLHQPHNIAAIRAVQQHAPGLQQVACFDTSFHRGQPTVAQTFAIPRSLTESGVIRYGFHGLSFEYIASKLHEVDPRAAMGRTIVAHLGNGASLCAMRAGVSIATTMGLTPLDGLAMGTRCGAIDPGALYLMNSRGMDARSLEHLLYFESGLKGVSGISSDMRTLLALEATDVHAAEAIELFVYRVQREVGSLAAALGGVDAVVLTGGIGEHAAPIRERILKGLSWLGVDYEDRGDQQGVHSLSTASSRVSAWVIPTNEELMIAQHTKRLLQSAS
jgi:acetate kinase